MVYADAMNPSLIETTGPDALSLAMIMPLMGFVIVLVALDIGLKGWAMWRAARLGRQGWFIALLIINSVGILPAIFLLITKEEYAKHGLLK
jgi:hypothetical protein